MTLLETRKLTKRFGGLVAVDSVDISIEQGSLIGLIGPNGAGKTTVFNLITGLYSPDYGQVLMEGKDLSGCPAHVAAAHGIARTFQNIRLFGSLSVLDNVLIGSHLHSKETLMDALVSGEAQRRGESELKNHAVGILKILGLEKLKYEQARSLPYGDQRRLEIARALAADPKILLLDEPAAGMHPQETQELMNLVRRIREERNLTILLIEHDMRFVMGVCEWIYVLDYGKVIAEGVPEDIRSNPTVIEAYLGEAPA